MIKEFNQQILKLERENATLRLELAAAAAEQARLRTALNIAVGDVDGLLFNIDENPDTTTETIAEDLQTISDMAGKVLEKDTPDVQ